MRAHDPFALTVKVGLLLPDRYAGLHLIYDVAAPCECFLAVSGNGPHPHGHVAKGKFAKPVAARGCGQGEPRDGLGDNPVTLGKGQGGVGGIGKLADAPVFVLISNPAVEADGGTGGFLS